MGSDFRFVDELRTRQTTIRDLLAHRTGLPSYKMALMVGLEPNHSRQDYCLYVLLHTIVVIIVVIIIITVIAINIYDGRRLICYRHLSRSVFENRLRIFTFFHL